MRRALGLGLCCAAVLAGLFFGAAQLSPKAASAAPGSNPGISTASGCSPSRACSALSVTSAGAISGTTGTFSGAITATTLTVSTTVIPSATNTKSFGSTAAMWSEMYVRDWRDASNVVRVAARDVEQNKYFGRMVDGSSAVSHEFDQNQAYTTAGALLMNGKNATVQKWSIDLNGSYHWVGNPTLQTCAAGIEGKVSRDVLSGVATGKRTKLCLCTSDGSSAYVWQNLATATLGTTTTCGTE